MRWEVVAVLSSVERECVRDNSEDFCVVGREYLFISRQKSCIGPQLDPQAVSKWFQSSKIGHVTGLCRAIRYMAWLNQWYSCYAVPSLSRIFRKATPAVITTWRLGPY